MDNMIICADVLEGLKQIPDKYVQTVVTSPPYWGLRQYLPGRVVLKDGVPEWVKIKLDELGITPVD